MLAGLIFATEDADDRPGVLAATLPFGGLTLVEFQARLLIAAGASQIVLVVARMTPELLGAINRIARRGVAVDAVRSAVEVAEKLHPLARVLAMADGLVTTAETVTLLAGEGRDALLVTDDRDAPDDFERVGANAVWAGLARLDPRRIAEVAQLPRDYAFQSTLLRVAAQAGAEQIRLPGGVAATGIVRDSRALAARGKAILASLITPPVRWADRWLLAPLARITLPLLVARALPTIGVAGAGAVVAVGGWVALYFGLELAGIAVSWLAMALFSTAAVLGWVRDEHRGVRLYRAGVLLAVAVAALLLGEQWRQTTGSLAGLLVAGGGVIAAGLLERAGTAATRRRWWASPAAYPLVMLPGVAAGQPLVGLGCAGGYAVVTLAAAIEALRKQT